MLLFNEKQLEKTFVDLFMGQGYDYIYCDSISRDVRDVLLYDELRDLFSPQYHLLYSLNS